MTELSQDALSEWVGRTTTAEDQLTPAMVRRFRATLDSEVDREAADAAPQGIHWCVCLPDTPTAGLGVDGHPQRGDTLPPIDLPRRMWASSEIEFLVPIHVGAAVQRRSTIADIKEKSGSSGRLVFLGIDHLVLADGIEALRERQTIVYRDAAKASASGAAQPAAPPVARPDDATDWPWQRTLVPDPRLLFRYSALTFNSHRIHYDRPYATEVEGYPGLIVHGPLTATLLLDLCARELGANRLTRFAFRAVAPAFMGESLHLAGRPGEGRIALKALGPDGLTVMTADAATQR